MSDASAAEESRPATLAAKDKGAYKQQRLQDLTTQYDTVYPSYRGERTQSTTNIAWWTLDKVIEEWQHLESGKRLHNNIIRVTGRVMNTRESSNKLYFMDLVQDTHQIQIVSSLQNVAFTGITDTVDLFKQGNRLVHRGDIIEVVGFPGKSNKGELSVFATVLPRVLAPCLHALPLRDGLKSAEKRYRNRHVDFLVNPDAAKIIRIRAKIISFLRQYLDSRDFLEVETPILSLQAGGATARPFVTHSQSLGSDHPLYLRIAPELYLKQMVVGGFDRVYEIGKQFRNEGIDASHNPEFTMCEFYRAYADLQDLMHFTEELMSKMAEAVTGSTLVSLRRPSSGRDYLRMETQQYASFSAPFARINVIKALTEAVGALPDLEAPDALHQLSAICREHQVPLNEPYTLPRVLDAMISHFIEPKCQQPTFLYGHPVVMSPLAKTRVIDGRVVAARFELFIGGKEIVNAYEELNDPDEQRARFAQQQLERQQGDEEAPLPDAAYCDALEYGLPPTVGWGMGVDRVCALFTGMLHLRETVAFPLMKPR